MSVKMKLQFCCVVDVLWRNHINKNAICGQCWCSDHIAPTFSPGGRHVLVPWRVFWSFVTKTNIDTQNDVLEMVTPFKYSNFLIFFVSMINRCSRKIGKVVFFAGREPKSITLRQILDAKTPEQAASLAYRAAWHWEGWPLRGKNYPKIKSAKSK